MSTIFTLKQEQVNFLLHGSFAAVSKIYHLEAPGILMLLSQKFPCDQTAVLQPYAIQRTARIERDDFDWQNSVPL